MGWVPRGGRGATAAGPVCCLGQETCEQNVGGEENLATRKYTQHRRNGGSFRTFGRHRLHVTRNQIRSQNKARDFLHRPAGESALVCRVVCRVNPKADTSDRASLPQWVTESLHFVCRSFLETLQLHGGASTTASGSNGF